MLKTVLLLTFLGISSAGAQTTDRVVTNTNTVSAQVFATIIKDEEGTVVPDAVTTQKLEDEFRKTHDKAPTAGEIKAPDLTVGRAAAHALLYTFPDEAQGKDALTFEDRVMRAHLADDVLHNTDIALSSEDITLIKKLVGKLYPAIVCLRVAQAIDPAAVRKH